MTTINCEELEPGLVMPGSPSTIRERRGPIGVSPAPALRPPTEAGAESDVANANEADGGANQPSDRKRRQAKKNYTSPLDQSRSGLPDDPSQWRGRRIRSRKTGTVYIVRQVFNGGRVELEKNWMTYLTDVTTVRAEYESYA